ncbi:para-nitrobenzyl esterase [Variovorax sp. TBS-050B]|uniref:carboxylesterase/lipase family protein n=1 Tax=Variovorax sp. TBS-050B TaxID=2940551 RepID=UPI00247403A7|nr:carboxylesterase family protein [Variovorax sp. TBS-050B]MDH6590562.1 para-nitrobenzyl esterase [Variovorax sp. TBS-050B]
MHRAFCGLAAIVLALLQGCASPGSAPAGTVRETSFGTVVGKADGAGTLSWKGVPFARPPVGALRWKPPADPERWTAPRQAVDFAPACVQTGRLYGPGRHNHYDQTIGTTLGQTLGAEDCLYLNIWAPAARGRDGPRPVIVWVHGGSNITGYTADPVYDGAALARQQDAVVVSVNYRLGIFGFLDLAPLKDGRPENDAGNFALLDIVKALEFVQRDIAAFGGDPSRVTLMGQSAGAVNVYALLTSPMLVARPAPLFHRLVALSGGISTAATLPPGAIAAIQPRALWAERGEALLLQSLLADGTAADEAAARAQVDAGRGTERMAAYLRSRTADALLSVVRTRLTPKGMAASNPIPDGWVVAQDPIRAIREGRYLRVPVLAGKTRDETRLFPQLLALNPALGGASGRLLDDAAVFALVSRYDPEAAPATTIGQWIPPAYLPVDRPATGFAARTAALDRIWFDAMRNDVLDALRSRQREVWAYDFAWDRLPAPFDAIYGAAHTFDLPFLFGNFGPSLYANVMFTERNRPGRLALSAQMMQSLGRFARDGSPGRPDPATPWEPWPARIVFDADDAQPRTSAPRAE